MTNPANKLKQQYLHNHESIRRVVLSGTELEQHAFWNAIQKIVESAYYGNYSTLKSNALVLSSDIESALERKAEKEV